MLSFAHRQTRCKEIDPLEACLAMRSIKNSQISYNFLSPLPVFNTQTTRVKRDAKYLVSYRSVSVWLPFGYSS